MTRATRTPIGQPIDGVIDYKLDIRYRYSVEGVGYESSGLMAGTPDIVATKPEVEEILDRYPVGITIPVYYDPKYPARSALITSKGNRVMVIILIAFVIVIGVAIFFVARLMNSH